jgi:PqqD family protein of HPr-rel-A system
MADHDILSYRRLHGPQRGPGESEVKPLARSGVIARPVGDEVVVYDPATHTAHCLNRTAALVFRAADGRTSVAALAAWLREETGAHADEDVVWATLDRLAEVNLLEARPASRPALPSRRRAMRRLGLAAAVLTPAVVSLVVPTPAEALNTCIPAASCNASNAGQPCYTLSQAECTSKICTGSVGDCQ